MGAKNYWWLSLFLLCGLACSPEVDVYAPERELYVVYGVLNPLSASQYVTVTKVFQYEGDVYAYAGANDVSARGLHVTLSQDSLTWVGTPVEVPDSTANLFSQTTGAYRFETIGPTAIQPGRRYDLRITKPDDPNLVITAHTTVPTAPRLKSPGGPIHSVIDGTYTLPTVEFSEDQTIYFERGTGFGAEVRVFVAYEFAGQRYVGRWGPSPIFQKPVRCDADVHDDEGCYEIPGGAVSRVLHSLFSQYADTVDVWDTVRVASSLDSLNKNAWVEVTGVDTALTNYLVANSPFGFGLNLLMDKQEYSNISGDHVGVFGSFNTHYHFVFLGSCTRYLAGLRGKRPAGCGN